MRSILSLSLFALSFALGAAQQTITVTPSSLVGWTVAGADQLTLSAAPSLALPAGAQLARTFAGRELAVKLTSRSQFGLTPADAPVLEIGPAALVFLQSGAAGKLLLVVGESAPVVLPLSFVLDETGRSLEPLTINFARTGAMVSIEAAGQTLSFPAGPTTGSALEVVASAGASQEWAFDLLEVTLLSPEPLGPADRGGFQAGDTLATGSGLAERKADGAKPPSQSVRAAATAGTESTGGPASAAVPSVPTRASTLEIFTPPAVRHGRAEAVRAALAGQKQN